MKKSPKVFISYAREDQVKAMHLFSNLKKLGAEPWIDATHLVPGLDWKTQIEDELEKCDYVVLLLSHNSVEKDGFIQAEKRFILERCNYISPKKVFLIPARLEKCEPDHRQLQKLHYVDLFPTWITGLKKIAKALNFSDEVIEKIQFSEPTSKILTPKDYFEIVLPTILRWKGDDAIKLNKKIRFIIGEEYTINLGPPAAGVRRNDQSETDLKLNLTPECMQSILAGEFNARGAIARGDVKIYGDLSLLKEVGYLLQSSQ